MSGSSAYMLYTRCFSTRPEEDVSRRTTTTTYSTNPPRLFYTGNSFGEWERESRDGVNTTNGTTTATTSTSSGSSEEDMKPILVPLVLRPKAANTETGGPSSQSSQRGGEMEEEEEAEVAVMRRLAEAHRVEKSCGRGRRSCEKKSDSKDDGSPSLTVGGEEQNGLGMDGMSAETDLCYFAHHRVLCVPNSGGSHRSAWRGELCRNTPLRDTVHRILGVAEEEKEEAVAVAVPVAQDVASSEQQNGSSLSPPPSQGVCEEKKRGTRRRRRVVLLIGCQSLPYLQRQIRCDTTSRKGKGSSCNTVEPPDDAPLYDYIITHHNLLTLQSLSRTLRAAAETTHCDPSSRPRITFVRCSEALSFLFYLLPPCSIDLCVVPMPVPFWSAPASYRRVVHHDFFVAAHRVLRKRVAPKDPRGVLVFTDAERLAEFMLEELETSRFMVSWARKRVQRVGVGEEGESGGGYARWLPVPGSNPTGTESTNPGQREFPQARNEEACIALAASKSADTPHTVGSSWIPQYTFARKYFRSLYTTDEE